MKKLPLIATVLSFVLLNGCSKENENEKSFTLEMTVDGVLWTAAKNQASTYTPSSGKLFLTGQKDGDEIINLNRDSVTLNATSTMPSGTITVNYIKGGSLRIYTLSASKPKQEARLRSKPLMIVELTT